ncbi:MAG TPA: glycosyltransferase 87 family protein [Anaerolineales bacterium]|nr:glycosyltransferase 87 family protein [Anaerolineales bacterium]
MLRKPLPAASVRRLGLTLLISLGLGTLFLTVAVRVVHSLDYVNSDFFTFWLGARMAWTEEDPYSSEDWLSAHDKYGVEWIPNPTFPYPLPLATLLAPLGLLPFELAYVAWVVLSQMMTMLSLGLLLLLWDSTLAKRYAMPLIAGLIVFRPFLVTLRNGQLGAFLLLVLTITVVLWARAHWLVGGAAAALLALKPSLGMPLIVLLALWCLLRAKPRALLGLLLGGASLLVIGWIEEPLWVSQFVTIGETKLVLNFGFSPTVWGLAHSVCSGASKCALPLGGVAALAALAMVGAVFWRGRRRLGPAFAASVAIPVVLLITPYLWAYDQILLILPLAVVVMGMAESGIGYLRAALIPLGISVLALGLLFLAGSFGSDVWSAVVPLAILALVVWRIRVQRSEEAVLR